MVVCWWTSELAMVRCVKVNVQFLSGRVHLNQNSTGMVSVLHALRNSTKTVTAQRVVRLLKRKLVGRWMHIVKPSVDCHNPLQHRNQNSTGTGSVLHVQHTSTVIVPTVVPQLDRKDAVCWRSSVKACCHNQGLADQSTSNHLFYLGTFEQFLLNGELQPFKSWYVIDLWFMNMMHGSLCCITWQNPSWV